MKNLITKKEEIIERTKGCIEEEKGASDLIAVVVIIVILLVVAIVFKDQLISIVNSLGDKVSNWISSN